MTTVKATDGPPTPARTPTPIDGVHLLQLANHRDGRGAFSPSWVKAELAAAGLDAELAQVNLATNPTAGTLRGLHFQLAPFAEVKIVQVVTGAIVDVVVDLRPRSRTFKRMFVIRLDAKARQAVYLPKGMGHGYQTLEPDTIVLYTVSAPYAPQCARGVHWRDPTLAIPWPLEPTLISDRDEALPRLDETSELPDFLSE